MGFKRKVRDTMYDWTGLWISRGPVLDFWNHVPLDLCDLLYVLNASVQRPLSIIQIGAYDGISFDPLPDFVRTEPHHVTLVEPNPDSIENLKKSYRLNPLAQVKPVAIGDPDRGEGVLYRFREPLVDRYADFGGTSSMAISHLRDAFLRNRKMFPDLVWSEDLVQAEPVRVEPFTHILEIHPPGPIDLIVIGVEGMDWEVLQQVDLLIHRPAIIQIEHRFLNVLEREQVLCHMASHGYVTRQNSEDMIFISARKGNDPHNDIDAK